MGGESSPFVSPTLSPSSGSAPFFSLDNQDKQRARDSFKLLSTNHNPQKLVVNHLCYSIFLTEEGDDNPIQKAFNLWKTIRGQRERKVKQILNDVSFEVAPGQLMAILGGSGSGKTTLLDVIACRHTGQVSGEILLNGESGNRKQKIKDIAGYVRQDDYLLPLLTVRETLEYIALLSLSSALTYAQKQKKVDQVIEELGLQHVKDTKVGGDTFRGISGGERKRVSIAMQLLTDPSILFLDEPTSGLDSFTARTLVSLLSNLAKQNNTTIIITIHQPRADIFLLFDLVMLLSKGQVAYYGPANQMVTYFESIGYHCPTFSNPCDYFLDQLAVDPNGDILKKYKTHQEMQTHTASEASDSSSSSSSSSIHNRRRINGLQQFFVLYRRSIRNIIKNYHYVLVEAIQALLKGLLLGSIYWDLGFGQTSVSDRFGLFYIITANYPFIVILDTISKMDSFRPIFYFERQDGLYNLFPYFLSKLLSEFPLNFLFAISYSTPIYWMSGMQRNAEKFSIFCGLVLLAVYTSRAIATALASLFTHFQTACFIANLFFTLALLPGGFLVNLDSLWVGVKWLSDISFIRRTLQGVAISEMQGITFICDSPSSTGCIETGDEALKRFSLLGENIKDAVYVNLALVFIWYTVAFLGLKYVDQKPHKS